MAITLNTKQKLNTYLLERHPGQLFDTYYRAIEEYINGPIYRTLNIALNDLFISSATPHGLDSWELFYTSKPGEMPYIKWAELLVLLNKTTREGPTFSNVRALLRFFDPTADISLVGTLAVLAESSEFTIGTPVPPYDQSTEYVELDEDSEFVLNSNDPPEFIVYSRDTILYETTILNIPLESYRELLKTLLRQILPANVRVRVRFPPSAEVYAFALVATGQLEGKKVFRSQNLINWEYAATTDKQITNICPFYGVESGVVAVTIEKQPTLKHYLRRYFRIVKTSITELILEDNYLKEATPWSLYPFGPDHIVIYSAFPFKLTKIKVNNISGQVIQNQTPDDKDSLDLRPTLHEQYIVGHTLSGPNRIIKVYDKDLNLVNTREYSLNAGTFSMFPLTKDKAFILTRKPDEVRLCDFSLLPNDPVIANLSLSSVLGTGWNCPSFCAVDSRSLIVSTYDSSNLSNILYRYYNWNPYTGTCTLIYSHSNDIGVPRSASAIDTTLFLFFHAGTIIKITNYNTTPVATTYRMPAGKASLYVFKTIRFTQQNII